MKKMRIIKQHELDDYHPTYYNIGRNDFEKHWDKYLIDRNNNPIILLRLFVEFISLSIYIYGKDYKLLDKEIPLLIEEYTYLFEHFRLEDIKDKKIIPMNFGSQLFMFFCYINLYRDDAKLDYLLKLERSDYVDYSTAYWTVTVRFLSAIIKEEDAEILEYYEMLNKIVFRGEIMSDVYFDAKRSIRSPSIQLQITWFYYLRLYKHAYFGEEDEFNEILKEYLLKKKRWLIRKKLQTNYSYIVDLFCLGCCAYAYDRGINIRQESGYIPKWVYEKKWSKN